MLYDYECKCGYTFTINKLSKDYQEYELCQACGEMAKRIWTPGIILTYDYKHKTKKAGSKWDSEIKHPM
ncbi:MAG: hypothetical protein ACFFG0_03540 [Candidatus Thorarchaeota archaeon]